MNYYESKHNKIVKKIYYFREDGRNQLISFTGYAVLTKQQKTESEISLFRSFIKRSLVVAVGENLVQIPPVWLKGMCEGSKGT